MKLVSKIQNRVYEELPGYWTVYGEDDISIGVAVSTDFPEYFWYFGDERIDAVDATTDALNKLTEIFGEPATLPAKSDVPKYEEFEPASTLLDKQATFEAFEAKLSENVKVIEAEPAVDADPALENPK